LIARAKNGKFDNKKIVNLWKMTWPMGLFLMMFATYDRAIDAMLIRHYLGAVEVAWYGLAYKIYGVLLQPAYFYVNSIFPIMSLKNTPKRLLFLSSSGLLMAGAIALVGLVYYLAPFMVQTLAGDTFGPSVLVLRILILASLFSYLGHLVGFTLISIGGQGEMLRLGVVALVVNLLLNIWLIPYYGILGAAGVTVFTEMIDLLMMAYFLKRKLNKINDKR
jgi:O-antigen/teichoic acid export membrane protein